MNWSIAIGFGVVIILLLWLAVRYRRGDVLMRHRDFGDTLSKLNGVDRERRLDESMKDGEP